jgi:lipoprotein-anchoring transpeptidase ErfK/SrfK
MKQIFASGILVWLSAFTCVAAQEITPQAVNGAKIDTLQGGMPEETSKSDPAIVHLQILLDRAGASPGVIDGLLGANMTKAIAGFEAMQRLPVDGKIDQDVLSRLSDDGKPVIGSYQIEQADEADLVDNIPSDYAKQAKMTHLGYTSVKESLSERFHMDVDLLTALNPGAKFAVGQTIAVAAVGPPRTGAAKRIEARRSKGEVIAYGKDGSILAVYPATIGSEENPSPHGRHRVNGVARDPKYVYNPKLNFQQGNNKTKLTLPSGPNNPVGTVWIDLSEPTYGIHGTPDPSKIDKSGSHGCVRLTNWDVEELANMVKTGVEVDFDD